MSFKHLIVFIFIFPFAAARGQEFIVAFDSTAVPEVEVGEVVISASRDQIRLKEMPVSVTYLSGKAIKNNEIRNLTDVSSTAPNFFMPDYGSKLTAPVYIRGVGSRIDAPSVGLYVDGVPYFEKASFNTDFFDIQRIEVLRGPQGTLYGRNTMAGIVNIVTLSPMNYQGTNVNLSAGTYGAYNFNAGHYAKAGDHLAYSLSANMVHNDGFFTNQYDGSAVDRMNSAGARNRIIWKPSGKFSVENIASYEWSDQGGYPYAVVNDSTGKPGPVNYNQYSSYARSLFSDALVATFTADRAELVSTTSYQYLGDLQSIDQDFTADSLYFVTQDQNQNMFSQEVLARSKGNGKYRWLAGAYGFIQLFDKGVDVETYSLNTTSYKTYDHRIYGAALFHQSTITDFLTKGLSLTGGLRLDYEEDILDYRYDLFKNNKLTTLTDTLYPSLESFQVLPRLAVTYDRGINSVYAVVAKGYKTGGYNSTFERPEDLTYEPEHSWNYEIGAKGSIMNLLFADVALFYIDWRNQQIYQTVPSGRGSMLKNAGHSASKGFEVSLKAAPWKGFETSAGYGFTYATFLSHQVNETTDYSGNYIPYVPKHTVSVQASKNFRIADSRLLDHVRLNLIARGNGPLYWNEANDHVQPFYATLDGKISFIRGAMQLDLWGRNVTGTSYEAFYFSAMNRRYAQAGKPARFGMNFSFSF